MAAFQTEGSEIVSPFVDLHGPVISTATCQSEGAGDWYGNNCFSPVAAHLLGLRVRIPPRAWMILLCVVKKSEQARAIKTKKKVLKKYKQRGREGIHKTKKSLLVM